MKIFLSSTYRDLRDDRWNLLTSLKKAGFDSWGMEFFAATPDKPKKVCLEEVRKSNLIILIIGECYGTVDQETGKSLTHLEYEGALENHIPILSFIKGDSSNNDERLLKFRKQVETGRQTVGYFTDPVSLRDCLWPAFVRFLREKGEITRKASTFQTFIEFFGRFLDPCKFFNHSYVLVGRQKELDGLANFIQNPNKSLAIIKGAGGLGKSKLFYELFSSCDVKSLPWDIRFLSDQIEFKMDALAELPAGQICIVVEDAHKRNDLGGIIEVLLRPQYKARTKLIISTRPSGIDSIKQLLASYDPKDEEWIEIGPLNGKTEALQLATNTLGAEYAAHAKQLVKASDGNSLVITVGGSLIRQHKIDVSLLDSQDFRDKVLENLLQDSESQLNTKYHLTARTVLATIAGIGPVDITSTESKEILAKNLKADWAALAGFFDESEKLGLMLRRGRKIRVSPDVLADYLLLKASVNNHYESTGFVDDLFSGYGALYFSNVLKNVAEIEYSIQLSEPESSLLKNVWVEIWKLVKSATYEELSGLLDKIEPIAISKPKDMLEICKWLLEPQNLIKPERQGSLGRYINEETILQKLPSILKKIAWHPDYTTEVCEILWSMANGFFKATNPNPYPDHPFRVFTALAKLDNHNYFEIINNSLTAIENIIKTGGHRKSRYKIQEILEGTLSQTIENTSSDRRTFTLSFTRTYCCEPKVEIQKVRKRALGIFSKLAQDEDPEVVLSSAFSLMQQLDINTRGPNQDVTELEIAYLTEDAKEALKILAHILFENKFPCVNNLIVDKLGSSESYFMESIQPDVSSIVERYPTDGLAYQVQYCMFHDWAEFVREETHEVTEARFQRLQETTALELWRHCNNSSKKVVEYMRGIMDNLKAAGIGCEAHAFQRACAMINPSKTPDVIDCLLGIDDTYLAFSVGYWFPYVEDTLKYAVAQKVLVTGKSQHKRGLASAIYALKGLPPDEAVDIIKKLCISSGKDVKTAAIHGLGRIYRDCAKLEQIKDIICEFDAEDDSKLLDNLFGCIDKRYGIDPETLSEQQVQKLLDKIKDAEDLDRNNYHIGQFLSSLRDKSPKVLIRIFLDRVDKTVGAHDEEGKNIKPFPYTGFSSQQLSDITSHPDFEECIRPIVERASRQKWEYYFWCPKIFKWLDPNFSAHSRAYLKTILENADENTVIAAGCLVEDFESGIVFEFVDFVVTILAKAYSIGSDCYRKVESQLASTVFSGSHWVSPPGKPDAHYISIAQNCEVVLKGQCLPPEVAEFYRYIKARAEEENRQKLERDKLEEEEEDF